MPAYGKLPVYSVSTNDPPVQIMTTADGAPALPFTTVPVALVKDNSNALVGFGVQAKWSAAPPAGTTINIQGANEDVASSYVTINTFTFTGVETTQRWDGAGFQLSFVRAVMTVHVGGQTCIIEVGR